MSDILENGAEVEYIKDGKWHKGTVHGVRRIEDSNGKVTSLTYLVDTGKVARKAGFKSEDDIPDSIEKIHAIEQPVQFEVSPEDIKAV